MLKQRGEKTDDGKWSIPAAERNKDPILGVLARVLPRRGLVLEIASGTGQHVMHFAQALPDLTWQPSDPDAELRESIALRIQEERRANVNWPIDLDVTKLPWPLQTADAVVAINLITSLRGRRRWPCSKAQRLCFRHRTFCSFTDRTVVSVATRRRVTRSSILIFVRTIPSGAFVTWKLCQTLPLTQDSFLRRLSRCRPTTSVWYSGDVKDNRRVERACRRRRCRVVATAWRRPAAHLGR